MDKKYIIVGGMAGGSNAAVRLRRLDEKAKITIFEKGQSVFFENCGLPYYLGGIVESSDELVIQTPGAFKKKYNIDVKVNMEVVGINRRENKVEIINIATGKKSVHKYNKLVLATGSSVGKPDIPGIDSDNVFTIANVSDTIAITERIKQNNVKRAVVVGGGYIGLEVAENLIKHGINTFIVEQSDHILPLFDFDMSQFAAIELEQNGAMIVTGAAAKEFKEAEGEINVELLNGKTLCTDIVILCTGSAPEVSLAKKAGLGIGVTGGILVDERQQTTDSDIYAVGDAVEVMSISGGKALIPLASPADRQGRIAADNICGIGSKYKKSTGVTIVKLFDSVFACAGFTEKRLIERRMDFEKVYIRAHSHSEYYPGASLMTIKMMYNRKTGKILGVQIAGGEGVDKRIDVFATAMRSGLTADKLADIELAYSPPFGNAKDPVNMAGFVASDIMNGITEQIHWHDAAHIKGAFLVDVRREAEFASGTIEGSVNIPLEQLRERLGELPRNKEIILFCNNGQNAYTAERILKQRGFKARNLAGGYSLYDIFNRNRPE